MAPSKQQQKTTDHTISNTLWLYRNYHITSLEVAHKLDKNIQLADMRDE